MPDTNTTDTSIETVTPIDELFESGDTPMILPEPTPQVTPQVTPQASPQVTPKPVVKTPLAEAPLETISSVVEAPVEEVAQSPSPAKSPVETPAIEAVLEPEPAPEAVTLPEPSLVPILSLSTGDTGSICGVLENYTPKVAVYILYRTMYEQQDAPAIRVPLYNTINFEQTHLASGVPYQFQASAVVNGIEGELSEPIIISPA